jgi:hypothetical protein
MPREFDSIFSRSLGGVGVKIDNIFLPLLLLLLTGERDEHGVVVAGCTTLIIVGILCLLFS